MKENFPQKRKDAKLKPLFISVYLYLILLFAANTFGQTIRVTILHVNDVYQFMPVDGETRGGDGYTMLEDAKILIASEKLKKIRMFLKP